MKPIVLARPRVSPCLWQLRSACAQLEKKDVITISPTGSGKTMTFWIPMLFNDNGIMIIITPLRILGEKNEAEAQMYGMTAINLTAETATDQVFKDIQELKYRVIVVSPERILTDGRFQTLFKSTKFTDKLFNVTLDEGHCVSEWGDSFRTEYGDLRKLRWLLPSHVMFHVTSATMPLHILRDVQRKLHMQGNKVVKIIRPNDRPNIHIVVEKLESSLKSMKDLDRILNLSDGCPSTPFMVFVNERDDSERLAKYIHKSVPANLREKNGDIWGIFCTDAAGMGLDLRDIRLVIQWWYTGSLSTLLQRIGRAARDPNTEATAVYFVEAQYFDIQPGDKRGKQKRSSAKQKGKKRAKIVVNAPDSGSSDSDTASEDGDEDQPGAETSNVDGQNAPQAAPSYIEPPSAAHTLITTNPPTTTNESPDPPAATNNPSTTVKLSRLCCDTCSASLSAYVQPAVVEPIKRAKRKFKVPKYQMGEAEKVLRQKLQKWRELQMVEEDLIDDDFFGSQIIMSNEILDRIVDLAYTHKITDAVTLAEQTNWIYADNYGAKVAEIVLACIPIPPDPRTAQSQVLQMQQIQNNPSAVQPAAPTEPVVASSSKPPAARAKRGPYKCRACGATGHNGK
ncbi:P-loop containing nucleoside triphosphate hydrolase protein [Leucogyrophana mollusca]|uniref:P-loop containing nucleoside triphosphate hydrolase protein n=1 Tax=Leucogyrophana mollusca TaxID=85980 RepID=A0ACB8AXH0_9AGAM|nr:P-loop containing nucleoside triphosphate hydrolase protein [Leucogyrophana mollusca]